MRRIIKDEAPEFWMKFVKKHPHIRYNELSNHNEGKKLRADIKSHMIKQQQHLCGYCCRQNDECLKMAEYIKPKDGYLHRFVDMIQYFYKRGDFDEL